MKIRKEYQDIYKVEEAKYPNDEGGYLARWFITRDLIPCYFVNSFLDEVSNENPSTGSTYAYRLAIFLNFLELINKSYNNATALTVKRFIHWRIYGYENSLQVRSLGNQIAYSTLLVDISAIKGFYVHLLNEESDIDMQMSTEKKNVRHDSFFYGQVTQTDYIKFVDKHIANLKGSKEYIKWYTFEQEDAILDNLKTWRDKAVFLLLLHGMRIDEVLSITFSSYNQFEKYVQPTRSKGRNTVLEGQENTLREIYLGERTIDILEKYLLTERIKAENESGKYSEWIFINLNRREEQGNPLTQANYRKILKRASKRAGLDPETIRTHSGRSTKVDRLLEQQIEHPEDGITDLVIRDMMGWKSIETIDAYKNENNKKIIKIASEKAHRRNYESKNRK